MTIPAMIPDSMSISRGTDDVRCPVTQRIGWVLSDGTQGDAVSDCTLAWGHKGAHVFDIYRTAGVQAEGLCWLYMSPEGKVHGPE